MKNIEKELLTEIIYNILKEIPLPQSTTHTTSIIGLSEFFYEMKLVKDDIEIALRNLRDGEIEECKEYIEKMKRNLNEAKKRRSE